MKFKSLLFTALISTSALAAEPKEDLNAPIPPGVFLGGGGVGPDAFGYTGTDSNTGTCSTQFVDITATGTNVVSGDDSGAPVTLGAPFNLYGTIYTDVALATNGYIATDVTDTGPDLSNDCPLPAAPSTGGGARIYPLHDDLISDVFYQFFPVCPRPSDNFPGQDVGCHVVQWANTTHFGDATVFTFEAILYDQSWEIAFIQGAGNPEEGSGSTTGIQNDGATDGLTYACNTASSVPAATAQCFTHPAPEQSLFPPRSVPVNNNIALMILAGLFGLIGLSLFRRKAAL
ncbi:hypothetical protein [Marinicella litoralis]|uniref:Secreted protein n=1 Tax=Marinicella litoralis TaxID=644220 RepID=A0A4V3DHS4_9GAMM|nr:hypothetical protein [Marinicella litoralis]TDR19361.1 hypothetical protein C8D91_1910 [Marinicella litoralis]